MSLLSSQNAQIPGMPQLPNPDPNPGVTTLGKGSLILFHYALWKNDPSPMVIISHYAPGEMIKGVNLHYLTFQSIQQVLLMGSGNPGFSYYNIRGGQYIQLANAFRSYSWRGIDFQTLRILDGKFLVKMMQQIRSFDPSQVRSMRDQIESQISQAFQPQAQPTAPLPLSANIPPAPPPVS